MGSRIASRHATIIKGFMNTPWLIPNWPAPANVVAFTTLRTTSDDYVQQLPSPPAWLQQVHGVDVVCADNLSPEIKPAADAAVAFQTNTVCVVRTADCLPVLLCDQQGTQVAAIHAGWRGLAAGIIANTWQQLHADPQQCLAWLGPAIGPQAFEVGAEVPDSFLASGWQPQHVTSAFSPHPQHANKYLGNLYLLATFALQQIGFATKNIYGGDCCTYSDPHRFYSYRRSVDTGRMASLIYLK